MKVADEVMLQQKKTTSNPPWDADPWTVTEVKGSQVTVQRGDKKRHRAKNLIKLVKQRVMDRLINKKTKREMEEPDCLLVAEIRAAERRNHNALNQAPSQGEALQDTIPEGDQPDKEHDPKKDTL